MPRIPEKSVQTSVGEGHTMGAMHAHVASPLHASGIRTQLSCWLDPHAR